MKRWAQAVASSISPRELILRLAVVSIVVAFGTSTFYADVNLFFQRAADIGWHVWPYRDFLWEYPPVGAIPLWLIPLTGRNHVAFFILFTTSMILLEYASLCLLRNHRPDQATGMTWLWSLAVVPLGTIAWFRLDFVAVLFVTLALVAWRNGHRFVGLTVAGFGAKLWPVVLAIVMVLERRWRDAVPTAVGCAVLIGAWWAITPSGFETFLDYRQGQGFQVESIPGSFLYLAGRPWSYTFGAINVSDRGFGWAQVALQAVFVLTPLVALVAAWRRQVDLVALMGALTCVMLLSTRLLSPQFLVWLAPFVVLSWPRLRRAAFVYVVAAWCTVTVIQGYVLFLDGNALVQSLVIVRNALLVWLAVELFIGAYRPVAAAKAAE